MSVKPALEIWPELKNPDVVKVHIMGDVHTQTYSFQWVEYTLNEIFTGYESNTLLILNDKFGYDSCSRDWAYSKSVAVRKTKLDFFELHKHYGIDLLVLFPDSPTIEWVVHTLELNVGRSYPPITFRDASKIPDDFISPGKDISITRGIEVVKNKKPETVDPKYKEEYLKIQKHPFADTQTILDINQQIINNYIKAGGKL